jgi:hypothetical protein
MFRRAPLGNHVGISIELIHKLSIDLKSPGRIENVGKIGQYGDLTHNYMQ